MEQQISMNAATQAGEELMEEAGVSAVRRVLTMVGAVLAAVCIASAVVAGAYTALCAYAANGKAIWPGISVLNQEISGLTVDEAADKLETFVRDSKVEIYLYDHAAGAGNRSLTPAYSFPLTDLGFHPDTRKIAQDAYDMNVSDPPFFSMGWRFLTGEGETDYHPVLELDPEMVVQKAAEAAEALSFPTTEMTHYMENDVVVATMPKDGRAVNAFDIQAKLENILNQSPDFTIDVPYAVLPRTLITAEEIHDAYYIPVRNAYYDKKTKSVAPGQTGLDFDAVEFQKALDAAAPGEKVGWNVTRNKPTLTYDQLKAVLFRDVLGSAKTHVSGTAARISNVQLAARAFNGAVLNAGEVFSYNGTVGQRTTAKGYKPAPAYVQGQTVDEIGGGVCQPSSTLYLACLRANMKITERYAHRYVPAYIPPGMDATVSWGGPDYKFTNNTQYPVKIQTSYSNGYLTVTLIGTKTDKTHVEMTNELLSTTPWKTEYKTDTTLPVGSSKVSVTPYTGYKYNSYRNIYDGNGNLISSKLEAVSDYKVRNKVILQNPG